MKINLNKIVLLAVFLCVSSFAEEDVVVVVSSQNAEEMNSITENVDANSDLFGFGSIEASMSRVVDDNDPVLTQTALSAPSFTKLEEVTYSQNNHTWILKYSSLRSDNTALNQFSRYLYTTKSGNAESVDTKNPCILTSITNEDCLSQLSAQYTTNDALVSGVPNIDLPSPMIVDIVQSNGTLIDIITIQIPHHFVVSNLSKPVWTEHYIDGMRTEYHFGLGMLFLGQQNNYVIFDSFVLVQKNLQLVSISQENSYAISQHVSFYTQKLAASHQTDLGIAIIEILMQEDFDVSHIDFSINSQDVSDTQCNDAQAIIDSLPDKKCITEFQLCNVVKFVSVEGRQYITLILPITDHIASSQIGINLLITANQISNNQTILSSLNFATQQAPQDVCSDEITKSISPIDYTEALLYRGPSLLPEPYTDNFAVINSSHAPVSIIEALMTVVLKPKDDSVSQSYFDRFTEEEINLDDLYMSHFLNQDLIPDTITNNVYSSDNARSQLNLDRKLQDVCIDENSNEFAPGDPYDCVTTHDWTINGAAPRVKSSNNLYFVKEFENNDADITWLNGIFGGDRRASTMDYYAQVQALKLTSAKTKVFMIHPVFAWAGVSVLSLKDKTIVSLSWSITSSTTYSPNSVANGRRLLSLKELKKKQQINSRLRSMNNRLLNSSQVFSLRRPHKILTPQLYISQIAHK